MEQLNPARHLYKRGWFGLIPLIGFFVGFHLFLLGAIKYRDKKLLLIGIAGMSFTILSYGSMFYYSEYSLQHRKDFAFFAQPFMNTLVKSIEFYKIQNGTYPDNLDQLTISDKMLTINDPILSGKPKINDGKFYYQKVGNKYMLFSLGIDRIPNTSDDIFPSEIYFTNKTGLIKPK